MLFDRSRTNKCKKICKNWPIDLLCIFNTKKWFTKLTVQLYTAPKLQLHYGISTLDQMQVLLGIITHQWHHTYLICFLHIAPQVLLAIPHAFQFSTKPHSSQLKILAVCHSPIWNDASYATAFHKQGNSLSWQHQWKSKNNYRAKLCPF